MKDDIIRVIKSSVVLNELYEIIGYTALLALLDEWGGRNLYVPLTYPSEKHPLVAAIGLKAAEALSWRYGGDALAVPTKTLIDKVIRNRNILDERARGMTILAIARKHGLSQRSVYAILAKEGHPAHENPQPAHRPTRLERIQMRNRGQMELFSKIG